MNKSSCPVVISATTASLHAKDLTKALRKLRRDLAKCDECSNYDECPILEKYSCLVQTALQEVIEEWNLTTTIPNQS